MDIIKKNKVFELFDKFGGKGYIGEDVTQLEHTIQCALLAEEFCNKNTCPFKNDFILGCLLHDIGHLIFFNNPEIETMEEYGVMNHEYVGANYLKNLGFNNIVCEFVKSHINTKRYLISTDNSYYNNLSDASKKTFEYQGGKLNKEQIELFKKNKLFLYHIKLREFDDRAKSTDKELLKKISSMDYKEYYSNLF